MLSTRDLHISKMGNLPTWLYYRLQAYWKQIYKVCSILNKNRRTEIGQLWCVQRLILERQGSLQTWSAAGLMQTAVYALQADNHSTATCI